MRRIAFALLIIIATSSFANTTGSLAGRVTNRDRPVPDVKVTISSTALQGTRSTNTNDRGEYLFPSLPPVQAFGGGWSCVAKKFWMAAHTSGTWTVATCQTMFKSTLA